MAYEYKGNAKGRGKLRLVGSALRLHPILNRRQFIGVVASSPLAFSVTAALAEEAVEPKELGFVLSSDRKMVTVTLGVPDTTDQKKWELWAASFGPQAWFSMEVPDVRSKVAGGKFKEANLVGLQRVLCIEDAALGTHYPDSSTKRARVCFNFLPNKKGEWTVRLETNLWSKTDAKYKPIISDRLSLDAFLDDAGEGVRFQLKVPAKRIGAACFAFSKGLISCSSAAVVSLSKDFVWTISANDSIESFSGDASLDRLYLGWSSLEAKLDTNDQNGESGQLKTENLLFVGWGAARKSRNSSDPWGVGSLEMHHAKITSNDPNSLAKFAFFDSQSPAIPDIHQPVSLLTLKDVSVSVAVKNALEFGPLPVDIAYISEMTAGINPKGNASKASRLRTFWNTVLPEIEPEVETGTGREESQPQTADSKMVSVKSPIGPLFVKHPQQVGNVQLAKVQQDNNPQDEAQTAHQSALKKLELEDFPDAPSTGLLLAASGIRSGVEDANLWAVSRSVVRAKMSEKHTPSRPKAPNQLARVSFHLWMGESGAALKDASYSRLKFDNGDLSVLYHDGVDLPMRGGEEATELLSSSHIRLGSETSDSEPAALLDLTRAHLEAVRDKDLISLNWRFIELGLQFAAAGGAPQIVPLREDCRHVESANGVRVDSRPLLVVEFPPQHVMEETIFRPNPLPLPEIDAKALPTRRQVLDGLKEVEGKPVAVRAAKRKYFADWKATGHESGLEEGGNDVKNGRPAFSKFMKFFGPAAKLVKLPEDQQIYLGPEFLDPDALIVARNVQKKNNDAIILEKIHGLIAGPVKTQFDYLRGKRPLTSLTDLGEALKIEEQIASSVPLYQLYREFYEEYLIELITGDVTKTPSIHPLITPTYLNPHFFNKVSDVEEKYKHELTKLDNDARAAFIKIVAGSDEIDELMGARLSDTSRLVFRINCQPPRSITEKGFAFDFTLASLTDWSQHEPSVIRRAEKLFRALPSGIFPPVGERTAEIDQIEMLKFQGIRGGSAVTGWNRMNNIAELLSEKLQDHHTSIEVQSRLTLSTAQDAVWLSKSIMPQDIAPSSLDKILPGDPPLKPKDKPLQTPHRLWSARLLTDEVAPSLRVVDSPDFRASVLRRGAPRMVNGELVRLPGHAAPPRGKLAPWFVGLDQMDGGRISSPYDCEALPPTKQPRLLRWLRSRAASTTVLSSDLRFFRTPLDANDRHQLVLIGSAYGLPVLEKASSGGGEEGAPKDEFGQFKPGDEYLLVNGDDEQAIAKPQTLVVSELELTALGGTLRHDTSFKTFKPALDKDGVPFFDGMSIERWQHWSVLGRDILAEVVYKGYLFPFGHRASLVKLTERTFLRSTKNDEIKAYLRQRMFIRIGDPEKAYPAVGQPNRGRQFCSERVELITTTTPDIVDPSLSGNGTTSNMVLPNGRIQIPGGAGLVFWPKVDLTDSGHFRFEFSLDGHETDLPLIFVNNVAAGQPNVLRDVIKYYNEIKSAPMPISDNLKSNANLRTLDMRGQALRYAPEGKPGDTQLKTGLLSLIAEGRNFPDEKRWAGNNSNTVTSSIMEGLDQPAFYPAVDVAAVELEQVNRVTGRDGERVDVQYDGHYLQSGFEDKPEEEDNKKSQNPQEVFLNLRKRVVMTMGSSGDRSSGIFRPESYVSAFSRKNGPLGLDKAHKQYETQPNKFENWAFGNSGTSPLAVVSLAGMFDDKLKMKHPGPSSGTEPSADKSDDLIRRIKIIQSYFSGDAKLLGVVRIRDLMTIMDIPNLDALPALKETVDYGTALIDEAEEFANEAIEQLRTNVLLPLQEVIQAVRREWLALDARLLERQKKLNIGGSDDKAKALSIKEMYPEVESDLNNIEAALKEAIAEESAIAITPKLAAVYEAGRRFIRTLEQLAAKPGERLEANIRKLFENELSEVRSLVNNLKLLTDNIDALKALISLELEKLVDALADELFNAAEEQAQEALALIPLPIPELVQIAYMLDEAASGGWVDKIKDVEKDLRDNALLGTGEIKDVLKKAATGILEGTAPDAVVRKVLVAPLNHLRGELSAAKGKLSSGLPLVIEARIESVLDAALDEISSTIIKLESSSDTPDSSFLDFQIDIIRQDVERFVSIVKRFKAIGEAAGKGNLAEVVSSTAQLARDELGTDIDIAAFAEPMNQIVSRAKDISGNIVNKRLDIVYINACTNPASGSFIDLGTNGAADKIDYLDGLASATAALSKVRELIDSDVIPAGDNLTTPLLKREFNTYVYSVRSLCEDLGKNLYDLFCATVEVQLTLQEVKVILTDFEAVPLTVENFKQDVVNRFLALMQAKKLALKKMMEATRAIIADLAEFAKNNDKLLVGGGVAIGLNAVLQKALGTEYKDDVKDQILALQIRLVGAEALVAGSLIDAMKLIAQRLETLAFSSASGIQQLRTTIEAIDPFIIPDADKAPLLASLNGLEIDINNAAKIFTSIHGAKPQTTTIKGVLDLSIDLENPASTVSLTELISGADAHFSKMGERLVEAERSVLGIVRGVQNRAKALPAVLLKPLDAPAKSFIGSGTGDGSGLIGIYDKLIDLRTKVEGSTSLKYVSKRLVDAMTVEPKVGDKDQLVLQKEELQALITASGDKLISHAATDSLARKNLRAHLDKWTQGQAAPIIIAQQVVEILEDLARGDVLAVIDIAAIRDELEDALSELIPLRSTIRYKFGTQVASNTTSESDLFQPLAGTRLDVDIKGSVDLLGRKPPTFSVVGSLGPFNVNLIPIIGVDAVTLKFNGMSFEMKDGAKPDFDVDYRDFEIGDDLKFIKELQKYFKPQKGKSGFFMLPLSHTAGIDAGYSLALGVITLGPVVFSNVSLNASVELPFTDREALFKASIGRRDAPVTVTVAPYGGRAHFGILANAQGIVGFEASIQFGGSAVFEYGPLSAQGHIMAGFYIHTIKIDGVRLTDLTGTFFAGGSASIWIFSAYTSLEVRLTQSSGGEMHGIAIYTFSFSMGFADFDYMICVEHGQKAVGSEEKSGGGGGERELEPDVELHVQRMGENWDGYYSYFDTDLQKGELKW